jgi:DNA-binding NtrC family response regulator
MNLVTREDGRTASARILVVEDDENLRLILSDRLAGIGYSVSQAGTLAQAFTALREEDCQLVLLDIFLPDQSNLEGLRSIRQDFPSAPVIVMTAHGSIDLAVEATREGAYEFVTKPLDYKRLEVLIRRAIESSRLQVEVDYLRRATDEPFSQVIGERTGLREVFRLVRQVAASDTSVLLRGETGTGKEVVARAIHRLSDRRDKPFAVANCAAIPKELMESEMFGHKKGSFTGAIADHSGVFETAADGTLLLDEIGDLNIELQAKILRVLENGTFRRVGGTKDLQNKARVIASTHQKLEKRIKEGLFREDLFYRLKVFPITLPPLRHRRSDIPEMARYFLRTGSAGRSGPTELSAEAIDALVDYPWPGNVRELKNFMERLAITMSGRTVSADDIRSQLSKPEEDSRTYKAKTMQEIEKEAIIAALDHYDGNRTRAAKSLGIGRRTLQNKLKSYGMADYGNAGQD